MDTVSVDGVQTPFEIVQTNIFVPIPNPVTVVAGSVEFVIVAVPEINVHNPDPTIGVFPVKLEADEQIVESNPAFETVGKSNLKIVIESNESAHVPFEIVHTNVFVPTLNAVIPEVGDVGVVGVAEPTTTVHNPVPTTGVFPASVAVVVQTVWSILALAVVGGVSRKIVMSSTEGVHTPLEIVQRNVFTPKLNPVTPEVGEVGVVTTPVPANTVHVPVPTIGAFAASVAVVAHNV